MKFGTASYRTARITVRSPYPPVRLPLVAATQFENRAALKLPVSLEAHPVFRRDEQVSSR
jgi:hypothetical protein